MLQVGREKRGQIWSKNMGTREAGNGPWDRFAFGFTMGGGRKSRSRICRELIRCDRVRLGPNQWTENRSATFPCKGGGEERSALGKQIGEKKVKNIRLTGQKEGRKNKKNLKNSKRSPAKSVPRDRLKKA